MDDTRRQIWFCEGCRAIGAVVYALHDDVMAVAWKVRDQHEAASAAADIACSLDARVILPENIRESGVILPPLPAHRRGTRAAKSAENRG